MSPLTESLVPHSESPAPFGFDSPGPLPVNPQRTELILEALKIAIATGGEHRLFRMGRHNGLFTSRAGLTAEAALLSLKDKLLESVRTETRGKIVIEWVRATPLAINFINENDSPRSILRELKGILGTTRAGVPLWMAEAKQEATALAAKFEEKAVALVRRLDELTIRVEAALRRAETSGPSLAEPVSRMVPWAIDALEYLDRRKVAGAMTDCPLPELFDSLRGRYGELTLPEFQNGLRRLHDVHAVRLTSTIELREPEYAMLVGGRTVCAVGR